MIILGIFVPLLALMFTDGYHPKRGIVGNVLFMEVVLSEGIIVEVEGEKSDSLSQGNKKTIPLDFVDPFEKQNMSDIYNNLLDPPTKKTKVIGRSAIPYKYFVALGLILIFSGVVLYKKEKFLDTP